MAVLFLMVISQELRIQSGKHIIVKTVPVDPRSLFRGDYIQLNYDFSRIALDKVRVSKKYFYSGDKIFVKIAEVAGEWGIAYVSDKPIREARPNEVVLSGIVQRVSGWGREKHISAAYGIESYFIPEGKGRYIEREIAKKRVKVELSVDKEGYASVCKLFIDSKEMKFQ